MDRSVEAAQTLYKKTNSSWYMLDWNVGQRQHIKTLNNWNMTVVDFVEKGKARFSVTGNLLLVTGKKVAASNEVIIEMKEAFDKINGWCPSSVFNGAIPQMTLLDSDGKILKDEQGQISGYNLQNIVKRIIDLK